MAFQRNPAAGAGNHRAYEILAVRQARDDHAENVEHDEDQRDVREDLVQLFGERLARVLRLIFRAGAIFPATVFAARRRGSRRRGGERGQRPLMLSVASSTDMPVNTVAASVSSSE